MRAQTAKRPKNRAARDTATEKRPLLRVILAGDETDSAVLKRRLETAMARNRDLAIDAGAVAKLTTAGVQVLLAAAASAEMKCLRLTLTAKSSALTAAFADLGFAEFLLDPVDSQRTSRAAEA
jgi:anti-anti-sigma regulatory factor